MIDVHITQRVSAAPCELSPRDLMLVEMYFFGVPKKNGNNISPDSIFISLLLFKIQCAKQTHAARNVVNMGKS